MSIENPIFTFEKTRSFLKAAIAEGAFVIPKDERNTPIGKTLARQNNRIGAYYMSDATHEEIGEVYGGISHQAIQQTIAIGMRRVWESCTPETQQAFAWEDLPLKKPWPLRYREEASRSRGGISLQIKELLDQGTNLDQIRDTTGRSSKSLAINRRTLRGWGYALPRESVSYPELTAQIVQEEDNKKLQEILDGIPDMSLASYISNKNYGKNNPQNTFLLLGVLTRNAGFRFRRFGDKFVQIIKEAGLPVRKALSGTQIRHLKDGEEREYPLVYYIVLTKRREEVLEALKNAPGLRSRKPV